MARHIPPRRVPRDRFVFSQGSGSAGGIFGGASIPGAHTHLEIDITDLDKFSQAAADARFLKLDASNDPMTAQLEVPSILSDFVQFDLMFTDPSAEGKLKWNAEDGALEVGLPGGVVNLQIGQETVIRTRNQSGATIPNGAVVRIVGASGNKPLLALADASSTSTADVLGVATEEILNNANGFVTVSGLVRDVNTSGMTAGDLICLSEIAGEFTTTRPTPPAISVAIGHVIAVHATMGVIHAAIAQHITLAGRISDVLIAGPTTGDLLQWGAGSVWEDKSLAEAGISALGHTHLEVDITDLDKYTQATADAKFVDVAGDIMTGDLEVRDTLPRLILHETDANVNQKRWDFRVQGDVFTMRVVDDANTAANDVFAVTRSQTTVDRFNVKAAQLQHNAVDVSLVGHTHLEADITDLKAYLELAGGTLTGDLFLTKTTPGLRMNALGTSNSFIAWQDDGSSKFIMGWANSVTSFKLNIGSSINSRNDFVMDATGKVTFGATPEVGGTAVSLTGHTHLEADITDLRDYLLKTGGTLTGSLTVGPTTGFGVITISSTNSFVALDLQAGATSDNFILFSQAGPTKYKMGYDTSADSWKLVAGGNFGTNDMVMASDGKMTWDEDATFRKKLRVLDSTTVDSAEWSHDGSDFNLVLTNTTDYNITGANLKIVNNVGFNNTAPITKPTVTGSRGGNAALTSLLTALANYGLITDSTT